MNSEPKDISPRVIALVVTVGLLVALIAVELLFRGVTLLAKPHRWSDRPIGYFMPDPSRSLQDRSAQPKSSGSFRISVVGDSFTFGPAMQLMDTFPKKLESFLNLNDKAPRVEVLNRGFSGFSTADEVDVAKRAVNDGTDLLVLEITLNDAEPHMLSKEERQRLFDAPYLRAPFFKVWSSLGFLLSRIHNTKSRNNYIDYHSKYFFQEDTYSKFSNSIRTMSDLCKVKKIPMAVILFPLFDFPIDEKYPFKKVHQIVQTTVHDIGLPFLDLTGAYKGIPHDRLQVIPGQDSHPNEIAHRIAAERLLAFLAQKKLVPEGNLPRMIYPQRKSHMGRLTTPGRVWGLSTGPLLDPEYFTKKREAKQHRPTKPKKKRKKATSRKPPR